MIMAQDGCAGDFEGPIECLLGDFDLRAGEVERLHV